MYTNEGEICHLHMIMKKVRRNGTKDAEVIFYDIYVYI